MYFGQYIHFTGNGPHSAIVTAVDTRFARQDTLAHQALLNFLEEVFNLISRRTTLNCERGNCGIANSADALVTRGLLGDAVGFAKFRLHLAFNGCQQLFIERSGSPLPARLTSFRYQLIDRLDDNLHFLVSEQHCAQHLVFGQFLGLGLHHQYCILGSRNHHIELAVFQLLIGRVEEVALRFIEANTRATDWAIERTTGNRQRRRCTDHGGDIRIDMLVCRYHGTDDLHFIHEPFGKQGANGTVDQTGGQRFFFAGARFTLEEAAGDLTDSVRFFSIVDRQREEVPTGALGFFRNHCTQYGGVLYGDQNRAARLASNSTRFQSDGLTAVLKCFSYWIHIISPILNMTPGRSHERPGRGTAYLRRPSRLIRVL